MSNTIIPFGKDAAIFYGVPGAIPAVLASRLNGAKDVNVTMDKDEGDASRRAYPGWRDLRVGMKGLRVSFELQGVTEDSVGTEDDELDLIRATFLTDLYDGSGDIGIALYIRAERAATANLAGGMWSDFLITKFDRNEPLTDLQTYSVEAANTIIHGITPTWSETLPI